MTEIANNKIITLAEIIQKYPNEWVLIAYTELDENLNIIEGKVLANSRERHHIYDQLLSTKDLSVGIKSTGKIPENIGMILSKNDRISKSLSILSLWQFTIGKCNRWWQKYQTCISVFIGGDKSKLHNITC